MKNFFDMRRLLVLGALLWMTTTMVGQGSFYFGFKGGPSIGFQKWNAFERDPLFRYHGVAFIESATEDKVALFAQAGYHLRGSAIRTQPVFFDNRDFPGFSIPFEFRNAALSLGAKQKFDLGISNKFYYLIGIRGEYTISTQLRPDGISEDNPYFLTYPFEEFVNKINYGLIAGGGIEFTLSEFVGILLELSVSPDFSRQYRQPEIPNVIQPFPQGGSNTTTLREREIVNTTFEISIGFRFLRKVEYID